jgi:hypothetical protein
MVRAALSSLGLNDELLMAKAAGRHRPPNLTGGTIPNTDSTPWVSRLDRLAGLDPCPALVAHDCHGA